MNTSLFRIPVIITAALALGTLWMPWAEACEVEGWPAAELVNYARDIDSELQAVMQKVRGNQGSCRADVTQQASLVFDMAYADLHAFQRTLSDFSYHTHIAMQGNTRSPVLRDEKIFPRIEKRVESAAERVAASCGFTDEIRRDFRAIILEVNMLKYAYQQTALGRPLADMPTEIRAQHRAVFDGISRAYHPSMTHTCKHSDEQSNQDMKEKLKSIFNLGAGSENALAEWRRAIALFRGGGYGMTASEYVNIQRRLLQEELARQGLTQNMKNVILQNFDCYKSRSTDAKNLMEVLRARKECMQFPVVGVDRLFRGWKAHISSARTTDERIRRTTTMQSRQARSVDIAAMYAHIIPLMSVEEDLNTNTLESLIELHIDLQATNEMIEKRIPKMQNNCMKWQPGIVGGCLQ